MLSKEITYTNYNNETKTKKFLFNYSRSEILELDLSLPDGLQTTLKRLGEHVEDRPKDVVEFFKEFLLNAYGEKSENGDQFIKTEEKKQAFYQSEAYTELFLELLSSEEKMINFINGLVPNVPDPDTVASQAM